MCGLSGGARRGQAEELAVASGRLVQHPQLASRKGAMGDSSNCTRVGVTVRFIPATSCASTSAIPIVLSRCLGTTPRASSTQRESW